MPAKPEYTQKLLWVEWDPSRGFQGGFKPIVLEQRPDKIWTVYTHLEADKPPTLPLKPVHHNGFFYEDAIHDWNWSNGKLIFATRVIGQSCWILLEYKNDRLED